MKQEKIPPDLFSVPKSTPVSAANTRRNIKFSTDVNQINLQTEPDLRNDISFQNQDNSNIHYLSNQARNPRMNIHNYHSIPNDLSGNRNPNQYYAPNVSHDNSNMQAPNQNNPSFHAMNPPIHTMNPSIHSMNPHAHVSNPQMHSAYAPNQIQATNYPSQTMNQPPMDNREQSMDNHEPPIDNRAPRDSFLRRLRLIPKFDGTSYKDLKEFIDTGDTLFSSARPNSERSELYEHLVLQLRGEAKRVVSELRDLNWVEMRFLLLEHFAHLSNKNILTSQLENLRQEKS